MMDMDDKDEPKNQEAIEKFTRALARDLGRKYKLRLYVVGLKPRSRRAVENIRRICEEHLKDRYELEVIDLYQQPEMADSEQIIAAPTLIKRLPLPLRRLIGDMTEKEKVLLALDLSPEE